MQQYLELMRELLEEGTPKQDRTGVGTRSLFGRQLRFNLADGFPLLTTKKVHVRSVIYELLWFLSGDSKSRSLNVNKLNGNGVKIWDEWADPKTGDLGPIYGVQWCSWQGANGKTIDQLSQVVEMLRSDPDSRRLIVSAWNVAEIEDMALPPCHVLFQFYVANRRLSLSLYQRSGDIFLGVPFNIASYSLLLTMVAKITGYEPGEFIHNLGDVHLYNNHVEQARLQLQREPRALPRVKVPRLPKLDSYTYKDIEIVGYDPHPAIKAPVAV